MLSTYTLTLREHTWVSKYLTMFVPFFISATTLEHPPLDAVYIFFDTTTFDEIEKDEKVTLEVCLFILKLHIYITSMLIGK